MGRRTYYLLVAAGAAMLGLTGLFLIAQSPRAINIAAAALEGYTGYRVRVAAISLTPHLRAEIGGLEVMDLRGGEFALSCRQVSLAAGVGKALRGEVETLVLTGPRFSFTLKEGAAEMDLSVLERLPPVRSLLIEDGEVVVSLAPISMNAKGFRAEVKNFSPKSGGDMLFSGTLRLSSTDRDGPECSGIVKGGAQLSKLFPRPEGSFSLEAELENPSYASYAGRSLAAKLLLRFSPKQTVIEGAHCRVVGLAVTAEGRRTDLGDVALEGSGSYTVATKLLTMGSLSGTAPALGPFKGSVEFTLDKEMGWKGQITAPGVDFAGAFALLKPLLSPDYAKWTVAGRGALEARLTGSLTSDPVWEGDVTLSLKDGAFSSPDSSKAGQALTGKVVLRIRPPLTGPRKQFDLSFEGGEGEWLWGSYYKDLKGQRLRASARGLFSYTPRQAEGEGEADLFGTGSYVFRGRMEVDQGSLELKATHLSHRSLLSVFVEPYLRQNFPVMAAAEVEGLSDLDLRLIFRGQAIRAEGKLETDCPFVRLPGVVSVTELVASLPFTLNYPRTQEGAFAIEQGRIDIARMERPGMTLSDISLSLRISNNTLTLLVPLETPLFGGNIRVPRFRVSDLLSPAPEVETALSLDRLDLGAITSALGGIAIPGIVRGDLPRIECKDNLCTAAGAVEVAVFGGTVTMTNISASSFLASGRVFGGDVVFSGISLEQATRDVQIGKMTGVIKGSLKNLQIEYGQPSRFVLDVESDPSSGVPQSISVDAIKNLSVLGTGSSAIDAVLSSGINRFFSEYPYSKIGVHCTLQHDTFSLRGTIREGATEYLIRKSFLRGIDVINQNPDNSISFRDMQERIGRIFRPRQDPKDVS